MSARAIARTALVACAWLAAGCASRARTEAPAPLRSQATRAQLESLATQLEEQPGDGEVLAQLRSRLRDGDFLPGDRVLLAVQGESTLTDTFTVAPDTSLHMPSPTVGALPLRGVLHAELQDHMQEYLRKFIRNPVVEAEPLVRLSIQGGVARGGYYTVPAHAPLGEALMAAGGTTGEADLNKVRIERDGNRILDAREFRSAVARGLTVDETGLRDGDQITVPRRRDGGLSSGLNLMWVLVSLAGGIYGLSRAVH